MGEILLEFKMASKVLIFSAALRRKTEKRYREKVLPFAIQFDKQQTR